MSFAKLDHGIVNSSIWSESLATRVLWITMLALKDENGFVGSSRSGLARIANISQDDFDSAISCLESPDKDSRTSDNEGRRVEKIEGGWIVLNSDKYRLPEDKRKEYMREYMAKRRAVNLTNINNKINASLPSVSVSVSESVFGINSLNPELINPDLIKKKDPVKKIKSIASNEIITPEWFSDIVAFKGLEEIGYEQCLSDRVLQTRFEEINPTASFTRTVLNCREYWSSKRGWEKKKEHYKAGIKKNPDYSIDMAGTYRQAVMQSFNIKYEPRGFCNETDNTDRPERRKL